MTFWIILGAIGVFLWIVALVGVIAICMAADEIPDPERDERASRASLYPTEDRDVRASVLNYMGLGIDADRAVTYAHDDLRHRGRRA